MPNLLLLQEVLFFKPKIELSLNSLNYDHPNFIINVDKMLKFTHSYRLEPEINRTISHAHSNFK